jgi:glucose-6-phosphate 1-dehydrogenase
MSQRLVVFGVTGDMVARYLLPALAELHAAGKLPEELRILGLARSRWTTEAFRQHLSEHLEETAPRVPLYSRQAVLSALEYRSADGSDPAQVAQALGTSRDPVLFYLALPPATALTTIKTLSTLDLPPDRKIVIEKPFGENLQSAQALNQLLHQIFPERAIFRIDHFLGKQTVQNILGLRFGNRLFEELWKRDHIERVEIIWEETRSLEGRATYYDGAGALRDMIQNHLLQILCLVGMEAPITLHERDLRDRKVDVLRAVDRLGADEIERQTMRARYDAGRIGDRAIPAYAAEPGIDVQRGTETFAQVTLTINNWRWAGVPFLLRTGKALSRNRREVAVHFRPVPHLAFATRDPEPNVLRLQLDPDRVALGVNINGPGEPFDLERVELDVELAPQAQRAYGRLLLDILEGDCTLSIRADEAELAWEIMEPILDAWSAGQVPLLEYPAGSAGPDAV